MSGKKERRKYFTQHLFRSGCKCPTKLYYKADPAIYPEKQEQLPFLAHIRYNKRQLRKLLEYLYPDGMHIETRDYTKATHLTTRFLKENYNVIFNASFIYKSLFVRIPVLEKDGSRIRIYNLQTKGFDPNRHSLTDHQGKIHSKWKKYLLDLAFQLFVIQELYPDWKLEPYLVLPDKTATSTIDNLDKKLAVEADLDKTELSRLLAFIPALEEVKLIWEGEENLIEEENEALELQELSFERIVQRLTNWYQEEEKVFAGVGQKCAGCEFRVDPDNLQDHQESGFEECWDEVLKEPDGGNHIFDLIGSGNSKLIQEHLYLQQQIPLENKITPQQIVNSEGRITDYHRRILQIAKANGQQVPREIIKNQLYQEMETWRYPLHFLDFEAGNFAVPVCSGKNPYHQVVFQYSCHTLSADGTLDHNQWVHSGDETYPNYELVSELQKIPDLLRGTIIHYAGFERLAMRRIKTELQHESKKVEGSEELIKWLENLLTGNKKKFGDDPKMADMGHLLKNYYYNNEMEDSLSIKDVLPTIMKLSPLLKERFSRPYNSHNFDNYIWWQHQDETLKNPYDLLKEEQDNSIGNGAEAMVAYGKMRTDSIESVRVEKLKRGLFRYCELDTLAMVMIYLHWEANLNS